MARVFWAEAKGADPVETQESVAAFVARTKGKAVVVTAGDEFKASFASCGGWKGWPRWVSSRFDGIVLPTKDMGKATFQIAEACFAAGKSVVLMTEDGDFKKVARVQVYETDAEKQDWKSYGEALLPGEMASADAAEDAVEEAGVSVDDQLAMLES